jgi:hypothetical protein
VDFDNTIKKLAKEKSSHTMRACDTQHMLILFIIEQIKALQTHCPSSCPRIHSKEFDKPIQTLEVDV